MRRAPFVIAGTVAGIAGVLSFPNHRTRLVIPASGAAATTPGAPATSSSVPATTAPAAGASSAGPTPSTSAVPTTAAGVQHANGAAQQYPYGVLTVSVTANGHRITDVTIASISETDNRSVDIDAQAIPLLRQQVLAAQATSIDGVSGATYTSQAYVDSVQSALDKLGIK